MHVRFFYPNLRGYSNRCIRSTILHWKTPDNRPGVDANKIISTPLVYRRVRKRKLPKVGTEGFSTFGFIRENLRDITSTIITPLAFKIVECFVSVILWRHFCIHKPFKESYFMVKSLTVLSLVGLSMQILFLSFNIQ